MQSDEWYLFRFAPFNRDIPLSGGRAMHQGIPKDKAFFALWDACHATTMALHLVGDVPRLRSPSRGEGL